MDKRHWREGSLSLANGNIAQREVFVAAAGGGEQQGAVLTYIERFCRGFLGAGVSSVPQTDQDRQTVFFVANGTGTLVTPDGSEAIREGDGILVPPNVEYGFVNDGDMPMEFFAVTEIVPEGSDRENRSPLVRNYRSGNMLVSHWSYLVHPIFSQADGLVQMRDVLVVIIDPLGVGDNHGHGPNMDEVWTMWRGEAVHIVGQEACVQRAGDSVSVCPCDPGHTLVNHTDEPVYLFYFCSIDHN